MTVEEGVTVDRVAPPGEILLRATDVTKHYPVRGRRQVLRAVDGVSLEVRGGETLGVVGESGCGKSTLGRCLVRLTDLTGGRVEFDGRDISTLSTRRLRPVRPGMQLVFQDPQASLNPRRRAGDIVAEPLLVHRYGDTAAVRRRVGELFDIVGLAAAHLDRYPHEFSGGQRQRIGIARALATNPKLIVADEPVSALDVSIQAQVINLLRDLQREFDLAFVFIAHDLAVVRHFCQRIAVMYLGKVVELGDRHQIYEEPAHPYTRALLSAVPDVTKIGGSRDRIRLQGDVPTPLNPPSGCRFRTRCWKAEDKCAQIEPPLLQIGTGQNVACHFPETGPLR